MHFRRDDRCGAVAAATILADPRLAHLTALTCKAQSAADLDAIGLQRAALIVEHCEATGLRRVARGLDWLLPTAPFRPGVLRVHNLPSHPTLAECHKAVARKQAHPIDVIEVGY